MSCGTWRATLLAERSGQGRAAKDVGAVLHAALVPQFVVLRGVSRFELLSLGFLGVSLAWACSAKDLNEYSAGGRGGAGSGGVGNASGSAGASGSGATAGISGGGSGGTAGVPSGGSGGTAGLPSGGSGGTAGLPSGGGGTAGNPSGGGTAGLPSGGSGGCVPVAKDTGWKHPTVAFSTNQSGSTGVTWSSANNAKASDNAYAIALFTTSVRSSSILVVNSFELKIPTNSKIRGVEVRVERKATVHDSVRDQALHLADPTGPKGSATLPAGSWGTADASVVYGSATDLWNISHPTLSAMIGGGTLAVYLIAECFGLDCTGPSAQVDAIAVRVTYLSSCGN